MAEKRSPRLTVDVIVELDDGRIVLVERGSPPPGWAIVGGFVEWGEAAPAAAVREVEEETGLAVTLTELFNVYSAPDRDPRGHTVSIVYLGRASGTPRAASDAKNARAVDLGALPSPLAFDHARILADYATWRRTGTRPPPA